jgi:hypothetical protein
MTDKFYFYDGPIPEDGKSNFCMISGTSHPELCGKVCAAGVCCGCVLRALRVRVLRVCVRERERVRAEWGFE